MSFWDVNPWYSSKELKNNSVCRLLGSLCNFVRDVVSSIELGKSHGPYRLHQEVAATQTLPHPSHAAVAADAHQGRLWMLGFQSHGRGLIFVILCPVYLGYVPEVAAPRSTQNHVYRYRLHVDRLLLLTHTLSKLEAVAPPLAYRDLDNVRLTAV